MRGGKTVSRRLGGGLLALAAAGLACWLVLAAPGLPGAASRPSRLTTEEAKTGHQLAALDRAQFAEHILELSEPEAYFDTDNLISNESSYLHPIGALERLGVRGGAYVGVGPDQNFSYIAGIRPRIAFIVDIRRDNLLLHLLFKSIFELAENRLEYLALLYGRPLPENPPEWRDSPLTDLVDYLDRSTPERTAAVRRRVQARIEKLDYPLDAEDLATIDRFHRRFIDAGLSLRFHSYGRPPRFFYPNHRQLLLERDLDGRLVSYLASEERYQIVRQLQLGNRVIPAVGDLAGTHTLATIGQLTAELGLEVSAVYTSNVEFYLWRHGRFPRFAETVSGLPINASSVIIRSHFGNNWGQPHPRLVAGHYSTQLLVRLRDFSRVQSAGGYRTYYELVTRDSLDLRAGER